MRRELTFHSALIWGTVCRGRRAKAFVSISISITRAARPSGCATCSRPCGAGTISPRFEYTRLVRVVPGGDTFSHPILTLGNRFADNEDVLLSTYLHEQMHWYLWYLGTPERDPVAPFLDELVRRYPEAPTELPDGARNYEVDLPAPGRQLARGGGDLGVHRPRARLRGGRDAAHLPLDLPHRAARLGRAGRALRAARPGAHPQRRRS